MENKTIHTVCLINTKGEIVWSRDYYDRQEAVEHVERNTFASIGLNAVFKEEVQNKMSYAELEEYT